MKNKRGRFLEGAKVVGQYLVAFVMVGMLALSSPMQVEGGEFFLT